MNATLTRLLRRPLVGDALSLYAVQGLNFLVPLLLLPYLLRVLSPQGYGAVVFAQSLIGYGVILTEFGFNLTAARDISVARGDPGAIARVYWTTTAAKLGLLLVSGCLLGVVAALVPAFRSEWPLVAASGLLLAGNVALPQWYFQGEERLRDIAIVQAVSKCLVSASAVLLVRSPRDTFAAALILSSPQLIGAGVAVCLRKRIAPAQFYLPTLEDLAGALRRSAHLFLAIVSTTLYLDTNTLILGLVCGHREVALYSVANRLVSATRMVSIPITQAVFPRASYLFATQREQAWELMRRLARLLFPVVGLACLALALFAPPIVKIVGGASYADAAWVVRIMAPVPLFVVTATLLSQTIMVNIGLAKPLARIYLTVGAVNLAILPALAARFGADGAAACLSTAEALGPLLMIWTLARHKDALGYR